MSELVSTKDGLVLWLVEARKKFSLPVQKGPKDDVEWWAGYDSALNDLERKLDTLPEDTRAPSAGEAEARRKNQDYLDTFRAIFTKLGIREEDVDPKRKVSDTVLEYVTRVLSVADKMADLLIHDPACNVNRVAPTHDCTCGYDQIKAEYAAITGKGEG